MKVKTLFEKKYKIRAEDKNRLSKKDKNESYAFYHSEAEILKRKKEKESLDQREKENAKI